MASIASKLSSAANKSPSVDMRSTEGKAAPSGSVLEAAKAFKAANKSVLDCMKVSITKPKKKPALQQPLQVQLLA